MHDALCNIDWYQLKSDSSKRSLVIILHQLQQSKDVQIMGLFDVNLELFLKVKAICFRSQKLIRLKFLSDVKLFLLDFVHSVYSELKRSMIHE